MSNYLSYLLYLERGEARGWDGMGLGEKMGEVVLVVYNQVEVHVWHFSKLCLL